MIIAKKVFRVLRWIVVVGVISFSLWVLLSQIITHAEKERIQAPGHMRAVYDGRMHVYEVGAGEDTIILLPGQGTSAPALDFSPLIHALQKTYKVVVVEPFGYGWSTLTERERSVENIVDEIRQALLESGIEGPYILMPHSASGIYAMYYASTYPEEVKGFVGIDCTLPRALAYFGEVAPNLPSFFQYVAPLGIVRVATYLSPSMFLPAKDADFDEGTLSTMKKLASWNTYNRNVIEEANSLNENIAKTSDLNFARELPVLLFVRHREDADMMQAILTFTNTYVQDSAYAKVETLDGPHYLHWTRSKDMAESVNTFLYASP